MSFPQEINVYFLLIMMDLVPGWRCWTFSDINVYIVAGVVDSCLSKKKVL